MEQLETIIKSHIRTHGPLDIGTYMGLCLGHPTHGYYMKQDPLGKGGDFTTAPEISQLFGEMIGVALADFWLGNDLRDVHLVEFGPGRGTLMADLLRATKNVPNFHDALNIHLVEMSPTLRTVQKEKLSAHDVQWHDDLSTLPNDAPLLIVANEFFDALPIRQIQKTKDGWFERVINIDNDALVFGLTPSTFVPVGHYKENDIVEYSPVRDAVTKNMDQRIESQGGCAIIIDYGHAETHPVGDTFQAVKDHAYCGVLEHIGDADLTSHVDFNAIKNIGQNVRVLEPVTQAAFLKNLGIDIRAKQLGESVQSGYERLIDLKQMGELFKVIGLQDPKLTYPISGFHTL